eukprot:1150259-Pelagomonas_calceolata.AAC.5
MLEGAATWRLCPAIAMVACLDEALTHTRACAHTHIHTQTYTPWQTLGAASPEAPHPTPRAACPAHCAGPAPPLRTLSAGG